MRTYKKVSSRVRFESMAKRHKPRRVGEQYCERRHYRTHACFYCMRTRKAMFGQNVHCPSCGGVMVSLGLTARVPKRDRKKWEKFEAEWRAGMFRHKICR